LQQEKEIKNKISFYQSKLVDSEKTEHQDTQIASWNDQVFALKRSQDSLLLFLEENYPSYYQVKYNEQIISIENLQKSLPENTAVIEYAFTKLENLAIVVTASNCEMINLAELADLSEQVVLYKEMMNRKNGSSIQKFRNYTKFSHQLYKQLFLPLKGILEEKEINNLYIIPDKDIQTIPFEALIASPAEESEFINYNTLSYLIYDYTISYQYSATLAFNKRNKPKKTTKKFIGFAPSFEGLDSLAVQQLATRGNNLSLEWTASEVKNVVENINGGSVLLNEKAAESIFKKQAKDYQVLHLATHAFTDENNPMNSKILLSKGTDSLEDGTLHAFEIYGMDFNAEMVTLSACSTGSGKLSEGEGTMSLARTFSYAGVPSVVMSHWEVDDKVTATLMAYFYQNLANGMSKDQSLRQAKLKLIKDSNIEISDPYFWAAFVLVGNPAPIAFKSEQLWYWIMAGVILLVLLLIYLRKRIMVQG